MINSDVLDKLKEYGQEHLLNGYDDLSDAQKEEYDMQLNELDFSLLDLLKKHMSDEDEKKGVITPLAALQIKDIDKNRAKYHQIGIDAIKQCKVAAVLLAGGQGTRLGFDKPKGMFNIGETKEVFIFQRLIENLLDVVREAGAYVPILIMTSEKNNDDTVAFFEEHNYFGYDKDFVMFFKQRLYLL